jgi:hypothetical protein
MNDDWVAIQFADGLEDMVESWIETRDDDVGLCLLCGLPIRSEEELIPGTDTHRCPEGLAFELRSAVGKQL